MQLNDKVRLLNKRQAAAVGSSVGVVTKVYTYGYLCVDVSGKLLTVHVSAVELTQKSEPIQRVITGVVE
jgi:hypothetical protein